MIQNVADTVMLTKMSVNKNPIVYVTCDKGNKKGNKNFAKYLCWYNKDEKHVKTFLLDVDCTDEHTDEIATAVLYGLKRIFGNSHVVVYSQCTNSGGEVQSKHYSELFLRWELRVKNI